METYCDKVIISGQISLLLLLLVLVHSSLCANFCNTNTTLRITTPCRKCYLNYHTRCPPGSKKLTMGRGDASCYVKMGFNNKHMMRGCQHKCAETVEVKRCCSGYWGTDCEACPSDSTLSYVPCSGRGTCNDTISGDGQCLCQENFSGFACERCKNNTVYGRNCDQECNCINGQCSSGIHGDGSCDCDSGYNGTSCDQELEECKNKKCPENSKCKDVFGWVMCTCNQWYKRIYVNITDNVTNPSMGTVTPVSTRVTGDAGLTTSASVTEDAEFITSVNSMNVTEFSTSAKTTDDAKLTTSGESTADVEGTTSASNTNDTKSLTNANRTDGAEFTTRESITSYMELTTRSYSTGEAEITTRADDKEITTRAKTNDEITSAAQCVPIDMCTESSLIECHSKASCTSTGPGTYNCTCLPGYHGDGFICDPTDPCQINNGGCDPNITVCRFTGPGQHSCVCLPGYELDPLSRTCQLIDVCSINSSYCSEFATCSVIGPFQFDCTCKEGYGGDGITCYNNIADLMQDLNNGPDKITRQQMNYAAKLISTHYYNELRNNGPFTLFIPVDNGFRTVLGRKQTLEQFLADSDTAKQVLRQHILIGEWTLDQLADENEICTLQGICATMQAKRKNGEIFYRYKLEKTSTQGSFKTTIKKGNIYAANGIVHIIGKMLTKKPEVKGDTKKTMLNLIKTEENYSKLEALITRAGMTDAVKAPFITMFTPENAAWEKLPDGALEHLMSTEGLPALRQILYNHIFDGVIEVSQLVELDRIKSLAGVEISVDIGSKAQILLNNNVTVRQADIPAKNGLYHHIDSLLLPAHINALLPSQCDEEKSEIVTGPCGPCISRDYLRCPAATDVPIEDEVRTGCRFSIYSITQSGCAQVCNRTHIERKCCPNFYSPDCHPCPGGFQNPCSGKGECSDGVHGDGHCICDEAFTGTLCDRCKDPNMFGPNCNQTCTCVHGECDNRIQGTGKCTKCYSKRTFFSGENCDMQLTKCGIGHFPNIKSCHYKAYCDCSNECACMPGYQGTTNAENYLICTEIDNCQLPDRGGCHLQARCIKTGPMENTCHCEEGWVGDGTYCYPSIQCDSHKDCHEDASCRQHWTQTQTLCECNSGYHGNGTYCVLSDPCSEDNGNCHKKATCTTLGIANHTCTCLLGYYGDGYMCSPSIYRLIEEHPKLTKLAGFLQKLGDEDFLLSLTDNYTLFAPDDIAMERVISRQESSYWEDPDNILNFIRFHTLSGLYSMDMLLSYQKAHIRMETLYDGFSLSVFNFNNTLFVGTYESSKVLSIVIEPNIPAVNGYIHIIYQALEPFFPPGDTPMLDEFFNIHPEYSQFGDWFEVRGMTDYLMMSMHQYTLFAPTNEAVQGHNMSFIHSRYLKFYVLPKIRLLSSFDDGETLITDLGTDQQLKIVRIGDQTYVNNVLISSPNMMTEGGVVHGIDGLLFPILHQCNLTSEETTLSECRPCYKHRYVCPHGYQPVDVNNEELLRDCFYPHPDGWSRRGCRGMCVKRTVIPECCHGYYGSSCEECPGGAEFPCNDNGICETGINGSGVCQCNLGYNGTACQYKEVNGTLKAWGMSCLYDNGGCSGNETCDESLTLPGSVVCTCLPGMASDGSQCVNMCEINNGGCHSNAECIIIEGSRNNCSCMNGYTGNGQVCLKIPEAVTAKQSSIIVISVLVVVILISIVVFVTVYFYWKQYKTSGMLKILLFNKYPSKRSRSSVCELLDGDDNEALVSQPSTPTDMKYINPLYNVKEEFSFE